MRRITGWATLTVALGAASIASAQVSNPQFSNPRIDEVAFEGYVFGYAMMVSDITQGANGRPVL
jgi:hypothetical protein